MAQNAVVIGSGISGLSISRMLSNQYDVKIIERTPTIGGLIKCERINGNLFHRVGGHVFNSKNPEVIKWFWDHFDKESEFLDAIRNAKILFQDKLIGYPIENFLHQLPPDLVKSIVKELINILKEGYKAPETYADFKAF
jgi:protoporphyrinogen oxidase